MDYESEEWRSPPGGVMRPGGLALTRESVALAALGEGSRILDLGCGEGAAVHLLYEMGYRVSGLDISELLIARGIAHGDGRHLIRGDAAEMPFEDDAFDAIIAECTLSELCLDTVLRECHRVLCDGPLLINDLYLRLEPSGGTPGGLLTKAGWESALSASGFEITGFHDRTELLTEFMVRSIWDNNGVPSGFECIRGCKGIGYFLLTARKKEINSYGTGI